VLLKSLSTADSAGLNNKTINAVMKVYSINGTLLKTSSYPQGFNYNNTESIKLATNIADKSIETVTAVIQLTNLEKTQSLSDPLTIKLGLGQVIDR
jgi:mannitol/fructose-specific phosphotransferase system IIA component